MLFKILQQLMKGQQGNSLPDSSSQEEFPDKFADYFINKIMKISIPALKPVYTTIKELCNYYSF